MNSDHEKDVHEESLQFQPTNNPSAFAANKEEEKNISSQISEPLEGAQEPLGTNTTVNDTIQQQEENVVEETDNSSSKNTIPTKPSTTESPLQPGPIRVLPPPPPAAATAPLALKRQPSSPRPSQGQDSTPQEEVSSPPEKRSLESAFEKEGHPLHQQQKALPPQQSTDDDWSEFTEAWEENVVQPGRKALHDFFYPPGRQQQQHQQQQQQQPQHRASSPSLSATRNEKTATAAAAASDGLSSTSGLDVENGIPKSQHRSSPRRTSAKRTIKMPASKAVAPSKLHAPRQHAVKPLAHPQLRNETSTTAAEAAAAAAALSTTTTTDRSTTASNNSEDSSLPHTPQQKQRPLHRHGSGAETPNSTAGLDNISTTTPNPLLQSPCSEDDDAELLEQERQDRLYVERFWTAYDDIVILSLFSQLGILCRLGAAYWFRYFDGVFHSGRALFTALPLNCLACFMMGLLSSGESVMQVIATRFTPPRLQQEIHRQSQHNKHNDVDNDDDMMMMEVMEDYEMPMGTFEEGLRTSSNNNPLRKYRQTKNGTPRLRVKRGGRGRRSTPRRKRTRSGILQFNSTWKPPDGQITLQDELREVQLLALERRIRSSPCLVLFAIKKEDVDVVEDYFNDGYRKNTYESHLHHNNANHSSLQQTPQEDNNNHHVDRDRVHGFLNNHRSSFDEEKIEEEFEQRKAFETPRDYNHVIDAGFSFDDYDLALEEEEEEKEEEKETIGSLDIDTKPGIIHRNSVVANDNRKMAPSVARENGVTLDDSELPPMISSEAAGACKPPPTPSPPTTPMLSVTPSSGSKLAVTDGNHGEEEGEETKQNQPGTDQARTTTTTTSVADSDSGTTTVSIIPLEEGRAHAHVAPNARAMQYGRVAGGNVVDYGNAEHPDLDQIITTVATGVTNKISRISRVSLADGWDVGTSPEEMSEDLMLGLRIGFCGAISSFSTWISSMVDLVRVGHIGEAIVGLVLGVQLPIVAYRFGQHVAVYLFIWRCRRETRRDERRGYGIRVSMDDLSDDEWNDESIHSGDVSLSTTGARSRRTKGRRTVQDEESEVPSVRAVITAVFIMCLVAQVTSLSFFYEPKDRQVALSLLFSPLGVLTRWRLSKYNSWRPNFPIGTFACNIAACALAGTLGDLLSGNPGPREKIVLVSIIAGFGGTLSSVARFIVEVLAGMDPILFRMDGVYYAVSSVFWGLMVSFVFTASVDWADDTGKSASPQS